MSIERAMSWAWPASVFPFRLEKSFRKNFKSLLLRLGDIK